jgi:hypothetical protein
MRWVVFLLVFVVLLVPAWWLNEWIAARAAARFDHFATDSTPMTVGEIDRFWPPLNDPDWTREPPESAAKTTRFGFTRWMMSHTSGADLVIWAYETGFPFRSFVGDVRSDPQSGTREFDVTHFESKAANGASAEEKVLPTGRIWSGTIANLVCYAGAGWLIVCGPIVLLMRRRTGPPE